MPTAGWPLDQQRVAVGHPAAGGQVAHLPGVERGLGGKVEPLQRALVRETWRCLCPSGCAAPRGATPPPDTAAPASRAVTGRHVPPRPAIHRAGHASPPASAAPACPAARPHRRSPAASRHLLVFRQGTGAARCRAACVGIAALASVSSGRSSGESGTMPCRWARSTHALATAKTPVMAGDLEPRVMDADLAAHATTTLTSRPDQRPRHAVVVGVDVHAGVVVHTHRVSSRS